VKRRELFKLGLLLGTWRPGRSAAAATPRPASPPPAAQPSAPPSPDADYIVVGSGAGGGTVAARLAEMGFRVLLLEAGGNPQTDNYDVPGFHPFAAEDPSMKWDFFVRHYESDTQQHKDPKYCAEFNGEPVDGVLYPRAATLGGCTAHNAMILVYPHNTDWDELADLTGDASWKADRMRTYFERLENCHHRPWERWLTKFGLNPSRHGWGGWLDTEVAAPESALKDHPLVGAIIDSARKALRAFGRDELKARLASLGDPNDWRSVEAGAPGLRYTPLTTKNHRRVGTRERILDVQRRCGQLLTVRMNALATRVLFDDNKRAIGVEYLEGDRLYRAHAQPSPDPGIRRSVYAAREVILAGGAFNTPQLLMLSGIGPREHLCCHDIPVVVDLPVGRNLQDRYEVAVVNRMNFDSWKVLRGAKYDNTDTQYAEWSAKREGVYTTNGALLSVVLNSGPGRPVPDLFCYALIADFQGYRPKYSDLIRDKPNYLTWVILKGHTNNTAGDVTLRSKDPRDRPFINFRYFEEGSDTSGDDLKSVVNGIGFVRKLSEDLRRGSPPLIAAEELPGDDKQDYAALAKFVRENAWGHHASCTCPIGPAAGGGVLSSDFRVHGTTGLRVVDASVFPRIPGLFIVSAVYMIAEKAADVIAADARKGLA
jgi:choline dehydrogenase